MLWQVVHLVGQAMCLWFSAHFHKHPSDRCIQAIPRSRSGLLFRCRASDEYLMVEEELLAGDQGPHEIGGSLLAIF